MPVKRKLNRKVTKVPRNVKINQKGSKRASQKKRGRRGRGRKSQSGGATNIINNIYCPEYKPNFTEKQILNILTDENKKKISSLLNNKAELVAKLIEIIEAATKSKHITLQHVARYTQKSGTWETFNEYITRKLPDYKANPTDAVGGDFLTMLFTRPDGSRKHKLRCFFE